MTSPLSNRRHCYKALKLSLVVGTALCLVNNSYFSGELWRIFLNYFVPFMVSLYFRVALLSDIRKGNI